MDETTVVDDERMMSSQLLINVEGQLGGGGSGDDVEPINEQQSETETFQMKPAMSVSDTAMEVDNNCETKLPYVGIVRSKTMPSQPARKLTSVKLNRMKNAKLQAEQAVKQQKVFTIQGPYGTIRQSLRKRGWVEKFYKKDAAAKPTPKAKKPNSENEEDDDDDDNDDLDDDDGDDDFEVDEEKVAVWDEEDGIYGIMSRCLKNIDPTLIWSVRRDAFDCRLLKREQIINHYARAAFTTKVGLCLNMRNVPWFEQADPDLFFPRCYRLSHDEEKQNFIDDFRVTACMNLLKCAQKQHQSCPCLKDSTKAEEDIQSDVQCSRTTTGNCSAREARVEDSLDATDGPQRKSPATQKSPRKGGFVKKKKKGGAIDIWALNVAMLQCEKYLKSSVHADIDIIQEECFLSEQDWSTLIQEYYKVVHEDAVISDVCGRMDDVEKLVGGMRKTWPQFELDGMRNVWIVKPGAQSRGRGIMCYDRLETMLKLVSSQVAKKDGKYIVQKYIERPLLIYHTKFDIRQWFLVTDWNPLTIWFYKDCYLRFCSQEFTLDDFDSAIHLSNNSIQKSYANALRAALLPADNMWDVETFKQYLSDRGLSNTWDVMVYPGMRKSIVCALLCSQDFVEYRKSAFALYGADFMLTEDFKPWLIEINSSPAMSFSTKVTAKLCANVMEDTLKVVIDRRADRNCDIGQFELAYKQAQVAIPPYIGMTLVVEGQNIPKPQPSRRAHVHELPARPTLAMVTKSAPVVQWSSGGPAKAKRAKAKRRVFGRRHGAGDMPETADSESSATDDGGSETEEPAQVGTSVSSSVAAVTSEQDEASVSGRVSMRTAVQRGSDAARDATGVKLGSGATCDVTAIQLCSGAARDVTAVQLDNGAARDVTAVQLGSGAACDVTKASELVQPGRITAIQNDAAAGDVTQTDGGLTARGDDIARDDRIQTGGGVKASADDGALTDDADDSQPCSLWQTDMGREPVETYAGREYLRRPVVDAMKASSLVMLRPSPAAFVIDPPPPTTTTTITATTTKLSAILHMPDHRQDRPNCALRRVAPLPQYNMTIFNDRVKGKFPQLNVQPSVPRDASSPLVPPAKMWRGSRTGDRPAAVGRSLPYESRRRMNHVLGLRATQDGLLNVPPQTKYKLHISCKPKQCSLPKLKYAKRFQSTGELQMNAHLTKARKESTALIDSWLISSTMINPDVLWHSRKG